MCVVAFAWKAHPRWRLVAIGNRDELHARPTAPLAAWPDAPGLIAGRDLLSGGTWLGVSHAGRFAVVTNLRGHDPPGPGHPSRGRLTLDYLAGEGRYAALDPADLAGFNPFNLIVAECHDAWFVSNRPDPIRSPLAPGLFGLSNGALDEPWPKTVRLKAILHDWLNAADARPEILLDGLREDRLPDIGIERSPPTDRPQEPRDSPIFIRDPLYGTRCSTVVAIDHSGAGLIVERRYAADATISGETSLPFDWPR